MSAVSAVIAVRDGERYLGEAIDSVRAQTRPVLEVVVVDDGSTDGSAALARAAGARVLEQPPSGIGAARNAGVAAAASELVAFLDADDLWTPDKLALELAALDADPDLAMVFGQARQFVSPELGEAERAALRCPEAPIAAACPGGALIRRSAFDRVGPFATGWKVGEFVDWYMRATELGLRSRTLPEVVLLRRLHASNIGRRERPAVADYAAIVHAALKRRRAGGAG